jgi:hypothetical protein
MDYFILNSTQHVGLRTEDTSPHELARDAQEFCALFFGIKNIMEYRQRENIEIHYRYTEALIKEF